MRERYSLQVLNEFGVWTDLQNNNNLNVLIEKDIEMSGDPTLGAGDTATSRIWDNELEQKVSEVTAEQILEAVRKHTDPERISIVRVGSFDGGWVITSIS